MALQVSGSAQLVFFKSFFGATATTTQRVQALIDAGVTFEVAFLSIRAFKDSKPLEAVKVTYSTTALIKGTAPVPVVTQNQHLIAEWVSKLWHQQGIPSSKPKVGPLTSQVAVLTPTVTTLVVKGVTGTWKPNLIPLIKAIRTVTGLQLKDAKDKAEAILAGQDVSLGSFPSAAVAQTHAEVLAVVGVTVELHPVTLAGALANATAGMHKLSAVLAPQPVNSVIHLRDAQALGQKVHGTSSGSVYHTIALSNTIKLAARIVPGGMISIRAEWQGQPNALQADLKKLEDSGVSMKSDYASIHLDPANVPLSRVIGAFLLGTGIKWNAAVMNGADLVVQGGV